MARRRSRRRTYLSTRRKRTSRATKVPANVSPPSRSSSTPSRSAGQFTWPDIPPVFLVLGEGAHKYTAPQFYQQYQASKHSNTTARERVSVKKGPNQWFSCDLKKFQCVAQNRNLLQCSRRMAVGIPFCFQHLKSIFHVKIAPTTLCKRYNNNSGNACQRLRMLGLFACGKSFVPNEVICPYFGEKFRLSNVEQSNRWNARYLEHTVAPYAINMSKDNEQREYIDALCERNAAAYANGVLRAHINEYPEGNVREFVRGHDAYNRVAKDIVVITQNGNGQQVRRAVPNADLLAIKVNNQEPQRRMIWLIANKNIGDREEIFIDFKDYTFLAHDEDMISYHTNYNRAPCRG